MRDLYQDLLLDHTRHPRNKGRLPAPDRSAEGFNPLCGDRVVLDIDLDGETIKTVRFEGQGCAISTAAASMLTEAAAGKSIAEAEALVEAMLSMVTGAADVDVDSLGKLAVFEGVRDYPVRVKCATLAWHTLRAALENHEERVTIE